MPSRSVPPFRRIRSQSPRAAALANDTDRGGAEREYTVIACARDRRAVTFRLSAATERAALAEITRRMRAHGAGWKAVVYDGDRLVARRGPNDLAWQRQPQPVARVSPVPEAPRDPYARVEALGFEILALRARLERLRREHRALEEEHATLCAEQAGLVQDRARLLAETSRLEAMNGRLGVERAVFTLRALDRALED